MTNAPQRCVDAGSAHACRSGNTQLRMPCIHRRETQLLLRLDCSQRGVLLDWLRTTRLEQAYLQRGNNSGDRHMSVKYYTHFLLHEPTPSPTKEFRGVVELNSAVLCGDSKQAVAVLARTLECKSKDLTLLQWSRLQ
jgi:hypothetical protein